MIASHYCIALYCAVLCITVPQYAVLCNVLYCLLYCFALHCIVLFRRDVVGAEQRECPPDQLRCDSGQCISKADFCYFPQFERDCRDRSLRRIDHCSKSKSSSFAT